MHPTVHGLKERELVQWPLAYLPARDTDTE